jgi:hypothetical protein
MANVMEGVTRVTRLASFNGGMPTPQSINIPPRVDRSQGLISVFFGHKFPWSLPSNHGTRVIEVIQISVAGPAKAHPSAWVTLGLWTTVLGSSTCRRYGGWIVLSGKAVGTIESNFSKFTYADLPDLGSLATYLELEAL